MSNTPHIEELSFEESIEFLFSLREGEFPYRIEAERDRHRLHAIDEQRNTLWEFRLPLPLAALPQERTEWRPYLEELEEEIPNYLIVLVQLGAAALGYFEEGEVYIHKTIKKYMKRHKRGKAQISYLNTRGKSKAGSRIRLANTVRFFEEINEKLVEWSEDFELERICFSGTAQVWGLLFQSNPLPPFEKKDERLVKVPMDVKVPSYEEMMRVSDFIKKGRLSVHQLNYHPLER